MATVYHRDQAGAPTPVYSTSQPGISGFTALKLFLKACLVTGYGAKPAAGWELIAEDTNHLILRNGVHSGYVGFSFTANYNTVIHLSETYTGVVNNVLTGDGLKTGVAASNAAHHRYSSTWLVHSSANSSWYMVADAATFMFVGAGSSGLFEASNDSGTYAWKPLYVGEDSSGNFIAMGGGFSGTDSQAIVVNFNSAGFTALKDPNTGLLVGVGSIAPQTPSLGPVSVADSWKQAGILGLSEVPLSPVFWGVGGISAGRLRGIVQSAPLVAVTPSKAAQSIGFSGALTLRNINTPINLNDGHTYFMGLASSSTPGFLVTDNPEFW